MLTAIKIVALVLFIACSLYLPIAYGQNTFKIASMRLTDTHKKTTRLHIPKNGDKMVINGTLFVYKDGYWVLQMGVRPIPENNPHLNNPAFD